MPRRPSVVRTSAFLVALGLAVAPAPAGALETWDELRPRITGQTELDAALASARPEIDACLATGEVSRVTIAIHLSRRHGLHLCVRSRPHDVTTETCVETAVRSWTTLLADGHVVGRPAARLVIGSHEAPTF